jgi:hypothetical protein
MAYIALQQCKTAGKECTRYPSTPGHRRVAAKQSSVRSGAESFTLRRITYELRSGRLSAV